MWRGPNSLHVWPRMAPATYSRQQLFAQIEKKVLPWCDVCWECITIHLGQQKEEEKGKKKLTLQSTLVPGTDWKSGIPTPSEWKEEVRKITVWIQSLWLSFETRLTFGRLALPRKTGLVVDVYHFWGLLSSVVRVDRGSLEYGGLSHQTSFRERLGFEGFKVVGRCE